ncbi:helix-turn-helix domain-containing protein [Nibricoccus sp. IMCC34717]|uniref:helix-turn-helix domain-containing protein n=1 Tax=Nibricoccus sp. IMCC34717 TaxID=3034021 RepID=UPI00384F8E25
MTTPERSSSDRLRLALSREEAAQALGISPVTLDRLTRRKLLNPSRATRRPLYPVWEVERFLRETVGQLPSR